jgi:hypothetical protein
MPTAEEPRGHRERRTTENMARTTDISDAIGCLAGSPDDVYCLLASLVSFTLADWEVKIARTGWTQALFWPHRRHA